MRRIAYLAIAAACLPGSLFADRYFATKTTGAGTAKFHSEYHKDGKTRVEEGDFGSAPLRIAIVHGRTVENLDPRRREYTSVQQGRDLVLTVAGWIARPPRRKDSGKTVHVIHETIDTGETKPAFGRVAKHLILRERTIAEAGACLPSGERERDGWFLQADRATSYAVYQLMSAAACRDHVVVHGRAEAPGIELVRKHGELTSEVVQFAEEPLPESLFTVPAGYRKVNALAGEEGPSWWQQAAMDFNALGQAIESWF